MTLPQLQKQLATQQAMLAKAKTPNDIKRDQSAIIKTQSQISLLTKAPVITPAPIPPILPGQLPGPFQTDIAKTGIQPFGTHIIGPLDITTIGNKIQMQVYPLDNWGVTTNPRAQLQTPQQYLKGMTLTIKGSFNVLTPNWTWFLTLVEVYGNPFVGTSPIHICQQGSDLKLKYTPFPGQKDTDLFSTPMQFGHDYNFTLIQKIDSPGFVEFWLDGVCVVYRMPVNTLTTANYIGPQYVAYKCYYQLGETFTDAGQKTLLDYMLVQFGDLGVVAA